MHKFFYGVMLGIVTGGLLCLWDGKQPEQVIVEQEPFPIKLEQPEFFLEDTPNIELVLQACEYYNVHHSDIVVAQAILETGHFKSNNCLKGNNLFGLYNSHKKEFFKFNHWTESVEAYRDKVQYKYSSGDYYQWLEDVGYAEDSLYTYKLRNIKKRYSL